MEDNVTPIHSGEGQGLPKRKRIGGWADDMGGKDKSKKIKDQVEEDERLKIHQDSDEDLPMIPDLDDVQEEELTAQVALPPSVSVNRVATFKQLDSDLNKQAKLFILDDVTDLKILTKTLFSESEVTEEDKPWDWNRLVADLSSDIQTVWDRRAGAAGPSVQSMNSADSIKGGLP